MWTWVMTGVLELRMNHMGSKWRGRGEFAIVGVRGFLRMGAG